MIDIQDTHLYGVSNLQKGGIFGRNNTISSTTVPSTALMKKNLIKPPRVILLNSPILFLFVVEVCLFIDSENIQIIYH